MIKTSRAVDRLLAACTVVLCLAGLAEAAAAAPGFRIKLLDRGQTFDLRDEIGKRIVVLRFQASWCKICVRESPALSQLADRYRDRVDVLALHVQDTAPDARRFLRAHPPSYMVGLDPKLTIGNRYGFKAAPYTVVVDRRGDIAARLSGSSALTRLPRILDDLIARDARRHR